MATGTGRAAVHGTFPYGRTRNVHTHKGRPAPCKLQKSKYVQGYKPNPIIFALAGQGLGSASDAPLQSGAAPYHTRWVPLWFRVHVRGNIYTWYNSSTRLTVDAALHCALYDQANLITLNMMTGEFYHGCIGVPNFVEDPLWHSNQK